MHALGQQLTPALLVGNRAVPLALPRPNAACFPFFPPQKAAGTRGPSPAVWFAAPLGGREGGHPRSFPLARREGEN